MQENSSRLQQALCEGAGEMGLELEPAQARQLIAYLQLFAKWNAAYNLSAVREIDAMLGRHLLDSLSIVPHISNPHIRNEGPEENWLDVGSGGGLPGIPLAILFPQIPITLLDSNGKKTRFLFQAKTELQLDNLSVVQARLENFQPVQGFTAVFSRAFASLKDFLHGCAPLVTPGARFYAMKGQYPEAELRELQKPFNVEHSYPLRVPGETAARHLVVITQSDGHQ